MQSRNTDELHDGFSSLLRVFDVGTSFYFLHAQKQLQPAPTLGTLTAAALLLFSKFLICKCFFLPLQQSGLCNGFGELGNFDIYDSHGDVLSE